MAQDRTGPDRRNRRGRTGPDLWNRRRGCRKGQNQTLGTAVKCCNEFTQSDSIFTVYLTLFISYSVNVASEPYRVATMLNSISENMAEQKRLLIYFII